MISARTRAEPRLMTSASISVGATVLDIGHQVRAGIEQPAQLTPDLDPEPC